MKASYPSKKDYKAFYSVAELDQKRESFGIVNGHVKQWYIPSPLMRLFFELQVGE